MRFCLFSLYTEIEMVYRVLVRQNTLGVRARSCVMCMRHRQTQHCVRFNYAQANLRLYVIRQA